MPTIVIDYENNAEDFWTAVHSSDPNDPAAHFLTPSPTSDVSKAGDC